MSYDLYFRPRQGRSLPSPAELRDYFDDRPHYEASDTNAHYSNDDTGVYFTFDFHDEPLTKTDEGAVEGNGPGLSFNINFFRPHVFGLEAAPELKALVETFDLLVEDPQAEGMGSGEFSVEGFLRGWNAGNRFGHQALFSMDEGPREVDVLPAAEIERCWRWNYQRDALVDHFDESLFVPRIMFLRHDGRVVSFVVWGDAIPLALPRVDFLLLFRKDLSEAPADAEEPDLALVPWSAWQEVEPHAPVERPTPGKHAALLTDPGCVLIAERWQWENGPHPALLDFFRRAPRSAEKPQGLAVDQILDAELVEECRRKTEP
jgi:hypothetical protein